MSEELNSDPAAVRRPSGIIGAIDAAVEFVAVGAFVVVMVATLIQVAARYLHVPIDWTEELARTLFLCSIMLGIALAIRRSSHIVVDFIFAGLTPRAQAMLSIAFDLGILLFLATWLRGAIRLVEINAGTTFVMLPWFPVSAVYGVEAGAIVLMILFVLVDLVQQAQVLRRWGPSQ
jgi:TRAP-type C4-dicarboxylate transport system permease small subunit